MITHDEGMAMRSGQPLNIQCLIMTPERSQKQEQMHLYHYHKYIELLYMLSGEMEVYIYDESYHCQCGDLIIVYSKEPHAFRYLTDCRYIVIKLLPEILTTFGQSLNEFEYMFNMTNVVGAHSRVICGIDEMEALMCDALNKFTENAYSDELFVRADIIRICAHIIRYWHQKDEIISLESKTTGENLMLLKKVMDDVALTCGGIKTHEAAQMCRLSDGYFSHIFKTLMGMSFTQYVKSVRMNEAVRLLKCTDETITAIAQRLHYATASHFIEDFRRIKGISPKRYRQTGVNG